MAATPRQGEAITLHDKSMVVTAGAGTGKTYVTCTEIYRPLENTRRERAADPCPDVYRQGSSRDEGSNPQGDPPREGPQWEKAAEDFMIAPVQTFHSFCAQVLGEFPIEAGLEPGFSVLDEQQVSRIHSTAYEDLIHTRQESPVNAAIVQVLAITEQYNLKTILSALYAKRERYARFFAALGEDEGRVLAVWKTEVDSIPR